MGLKVVQHVRADLRRARHAGQGLAARRRARRHPADVPDHRVRPDDGRHQGDRHAVDRLPQRARVRQEPRAGRRPDRGRPTRPRRGSPSPTTRTCAARCCCRSRTPRACARWSATRRAGRTGLALAEFAGDSAGAEHGRSGSTTCCCRWSRAAARSGRTSCSATSRCRPSAAPATCRTTRWSSTSGTRRSTPCTRAPPRSRASTSSSARSLKDGGRALSTVAGEIQAVPRRRGRQRPAQGGADRARRGARPMCEEMLGTLTDWLAVAGGDPASSTRSA